MTVRKARTSLVQMVLALVVLGSGLASAEDFSGLRVEKRWKVTLYRANGTRPGQKPASSLSQGGIGMVFTGDPNTALLTTTNPAYRDDLLGDLTGATISATIGIVDANMPQYTYYNTGGSTPAHTRLYLRTLNKELGESQYWWSNPVSISLADLTLLGTTTLVVALDPTQWSDRAGHLASDPNYTPAFQQAVADVAEIGLSFGGGNNFAFGVGVSSGTATFQLRQIDAR